MSVLNTCGVFRVPNETEEKPTITCSNKACNKVFDKPLKTINLQHNPNIFHDACPYCLEEIPLTETKIEKQSENTVTPETEFEDEKLVKTQEKPSNCKYHFGYLTAKERKQQIPDECMVCPEVIDCMIKH